MTESYGTSGGVELTNEVIEQLAAEAEAGYEIDPRTPIFDGLRDEMGTVDEGKPPAFRHGDGTSCHGCQSCLAEALAKVEAQEGL